MDCENCRYTRQIPFAAIRHRHSELDEFELDEFENPTQFIKLTAGKVLRGSCFETLKTEFELTEYADTRMTS